MYRKILSAPAHINGKALMIARQHPSSREQASNLTPTPLNPSKMLRMITGDGF